MNWLISVLALLVSLLSTASAWSASNRALDQQDRHFAAERGDRRWELRQERIRESYDLLYRAVLDLRSWADDQIGRTR